MEDVQPAYTLAGAEWLTFSESERKRCPELLKICTFVVSDRFSPAAKCSRSAAGEGAARVGLGT